MTKLIIASVLALSVFAGHARAEDDPLVGTWKLNLAKSKYIPGPAPQSLVHKYESTGKDKYKNTRDGVDASGKPTHMELDLSYDGHEHPVSRPQADATMDRRIDSHNVEGMSLKEGRLVTVMMRSVSADGKVLTFKQMGTDAQGQPFSTLEVFDKQ